MRKQGGIGESNTNTNTNKVCANKVGSGNQIQMREQIKTLRYEGTQGADQSLLALQKIECLPKQG